MCKSVPAMIFVIVSVLFTTVVAQDQPEDSAKEKISAERQLILKDMRSGVAAMSLSVKNGDSLQAATLVQEPVFRYSDPQREIADGTMWVWTVDDLPVATMKLERCTLPEPERQWLFNVGSASPKLIAVKWPFGHEFESKKPGLTFQPVESGPKLSDSKSTRLLQLKQLSRRFSATLLGAAGPDDKSEMRLLATPLFRYSSKTGHISDGALFGLSATGTNPDAIVAIQWREEEPAGHWEFGCFGTTTGGLQVRIDEAIVWSQPILVGQGTLFDTWTWFFSAEVQ